MAFRSKAVMDVLQGVLRACFVGFRTTRADLQRVVTQTVAIGREQEGMSKMPSPKSLTAAPTDRYGSSRENVNQPEDERTCVKLLAKEQQVGRFPGSIKLINIPDGFINGLHDNCLH